MRKERFDIPIAVAATNEVEARIAEAEPGEFEASAPERADAEIGGDLLGAEDRFSAVGGIVADGEVLHVEAGLGKQAQADGVEIDGAFEGAAHRGGNVGTISAEIDERR